VLKYTDLEAEPVTVLALERLESGAPPGKLEFPLFVVRVQLARCQSRHITAAIGQSSTNRR